MKMIIVIVQDNDADTLTQAFTAGSFRVTRIASTGGFLRRGVVTMLLLDLAPRPEDTSGVEGYIINMYVAPAHRRHGLGRQLLAACRREADELGLRRLLLYATPGGKSLYEGAGFKPNPNWMELPL